MPYSVQKRSWVDNFSKLVEYHPLMQNDQIRLSITAVVASDYFNLCENFFCVTTELVKKVYRCMNNVSI